MELGRGFPTPFSNPSIDSTHAPPWNSYTDSFRGKTISAYRVSLLRGWFRLNPRLGEERVQLIFFWEGEGEGIRVRRGTKSFSSKVEIYGSKFADWRMKRLDIAWGEMEKGNSSVKEKKEEQVKEVEIFSVYVILCWLRGILIGLRMTLILVLYASEGCARYCEF